MPGLTLEDVKSKREEILALAQSHKATRVRLFGSVVRRESGDSSDVDFLVDFEPGASAIDHVGFVHGLEGLLGTGVAVISAGGLQRRHDGILREAVEL
jgi:predicted nucleotidyltransferase